MTRGMLASTIALAAVTALGACTTVAPEDPCKDATVSRLYFGLDTPSGEVTDEEWYAFVAEVMTPHFPDGFTVLPGHGQWRGAQGQLVSEGTRIVEFVHDGSPKQRA